jgi:hypothetical protein
MWRMRALADEFAAADPYRLSATIVASKEDFDDLKQTLKQVIAQHGHRIESVEPDLLYQVNIDLFELTRS